MQVLGVGEWKEALQAGGGRGGWPVALCNESGRDGRDERCGTGFGRECRMANELKWLKRAGGACAQLRAKRRKGLSPAPLSLLSRLGRFTVNSLVARRRATPRKVMAVTSHSFHS